MLAGSRSQGEIGTYAWGGVVLLAGVAAAWAITHATSGPGSQISRGLSTVFLVLTPALVVLLIQSGLARVLVVVAGGMLVLGTSGELSVWKIVYLLAVGLAVGIVTVRLPRLSRTTSHAMTRRVLRLSLLLFLVVVFRVGLALLEGTAPELALRDAAPYLLFALIPLLAVDAAASLTERRLASVFLLAAGLGTVAYAIEWVAKRGIGDFPVDRLTLAGSLPAALFAYASAKALLGRRRLLWASVAMLTLGLVSLTGNRSMLIMLLAPLVIVLVGPYRLRRSTRLVVLIGALGLAVPIAMAAGGRFGIATDVVAERLGSLADPASLRADQSLSIRRAHSEAAHAAFSERPVLGVGPGYQFVWAHPTTRQRVGTGFTLDSPLVTPAKFGIVGMAAFLLLFGGYASLFTRLRNAPNIAASALIGFAVVQLVRAVTIGPAIEDKGFVFAFLLLLAMSLNNASRIWQEQGPTLTQGWPHRRPSPSRSCTSPSP